MKISKEEVEHVSQLSRIELSDEEEAKYAEDLSAILDYASELDAAPTLDVVAIDQIAGLRNIVREDKIKPSLSNEEVLQNAPEKEKGFIKTKKILE